MSGEAINAIKKGEFDSITISLLATNIELRFNTCSSFISKVRNRISSIANSERTQGQEMLQRIVLLGKFDKK